MLAWHLAGALFLFRWIFRDPQVDVRMLLLGAILPDLIDLPIGTVLAADVYSSGELWAHTLLAPSLVLLAVMVFTRRGGRRKAWVALVVGMFFHLLLDGMWASTEGFLWPLFGWDFPSQPSPYWSGAWDRALSDPRRWILEAAGVTYLAVQWRRAHITPPTA